MRESIDAPITRISSDCGGKAAIVEIRAPEISRLIAPGQFVSVKPPGGGLNILRRPFSVAGRAKDNLVLLIKIVGPVTRSIAGMKSGEYLNVIGPLGKGYRGIGKGAKEIILVGGGHGTASLVFLAERICSGRERANIQFIIGAKTKNEIPIRREIMANRRIKVKFATEDGSIGNRGTAVDLFKEELKGDRRCCQIFACGPVPMLSNIAKAARNMSLQVSIETHMACGMGRCQGCVVPVIGGRGMYKYKRACMDGPVFEAAEVDWAALGAGKDG